MADPAGPSPSTTVGGVSAWFRQYGCDVVEKGLVIGAVPRDAEDVATLVGLGVTRVVCLVADGEYATGERAAVAEAYAAAGIAESRVPSQDFGALGPATLERSSGLVAAALRDGETLYLHCRAGWQRSAVTAAAALSRRTGVPPERTLEQVRARRPDACPLPHQVEDLERWWTARDGGGAEPSAPSGCAGP